MKEELKTIHDFDFQLICDFFKLLERQGPGSEDITLKALSFIDNLPGDAKIADIGSGTGGQTMTLAKNTQGTIVAIDLFPDFISILNDTARKLSFDKRIEGIVASMEDLPFREGELDLIWAEGSIYNIGFEKGLREWNKYLKKGGYIAVSEASWFTEKRPSEIEDFWRNAYPEIDTISAKVRQVEQAGYIPVSTFVVPETCWLDSFYAPMEQPRKDFLKNYSGNKAAVDFIANQMHEEKLYNKYKEYYGYVFYIGKKI